MSVVVAGTTAGVLLSQAGSSTACTNCEFVPLNNSVTWVSVGDWGRNGTANQVAVSAAMAHYAERFNAAFVLSVGDQFYWNGVGSETDPQWNSSFLGIYNHTALRTRPWYMIAGNHDYDGNLTAQINWQLDPAKRWNFPSLNYTLTWPMPNARDARDCLSFVLLDTCPFLSAYRRRPENPSMGANLNKTDPTAQRAWIYEQVAYACSRCRATVGVGHHPVFSGGYHGDEPELIALLTPLFNATTVSAYISGHDHTLIHASANSIDYIVSGGGSDIRTDTKSTPETVWFKDAPGFTIHSMNGTHAYHAFIGTNRAVLHSTLRPLRT